MTYIYSEDSTPDTGEVKEEFLSIGNLAGEGRGRKSQLYMDHALCIRRKAVHALGKVKWHKGEGESGIDGVCMIHRGVSHGV